MAVAGYNFYENTGSGYVKRNGSLLATPNYTRTGLGEGVSGSCYFTAVDDAGNESAAGAVGNFITATAQSIIVASDGFGDGVIDNTKWTVYNANPVNVTIEERGGRMYLTSNNISDTSVSNFFDNRVESIQTIADGTAAGQIFRSATVGSVFQFSLGVDQNNRAMVMRRAGLVPGATIRILVGGSTVYTLDLDTPTISSRWKILRFNGQVQFKYWTGSQWQQVGTTQTANIGTNLKAIFSATDGGSGYVENSIDNYYLTNSDYSTEGPQ
jgi:hypothetical protein